MNYSIIYKNIHQKEIQIQNINFYHRQIVKFDMYSLINKYIKKNKNKLFYYI